MLTVLEHDPSHQLPDANNKQSTAYPLLSNHALDTIMTILPKITTLLHWVHNASGLDMLSEECHQHTTSIQTRLQEVLLKVVGRLLKGMIVHCTAPQHRSFIALHRFDPFQQLLTAHIRQIFPSKVTWRLTDSFALG